MSWSAFGWDRNLPMTWTTLNTNLLQYDNYSDNSGTVTASEGTDCLCSGKGYNCSNFHPEQIYQSKCASEDARLLLTFPGDTWYDNCQDQGICCPECPGICTNFVCNCNRKYHEICGNFNAAKTLLLGTYGVGICAGVKKSNAKMSWSGFRWDQNMPVTGTTLNTNLLQYQQLIVNPDIQVDCDNGCDCICTNDHHCNLDPPNTCPPNVPSIAQNSISDVWRDDTETCCAHDGGACIVYGCACHRKYSQSCGILNPSLMLLLGTYGVGACATASCKQNTDWAITDASKSVYVGWVNAIYSFDFTNYSYPSHHGDFHNWLLDVCQKTSSSAPAGMDATAILRIRDSNVVYVILYEFFNRIFIDGYYGKNISHKAEDDFLSYNFFNQGFDAYSLTLTRTIFFSFSGLYPSGYPDTFLTLIHTLLKPPLPRQTDPSTFTLSFQLSYTQYQNYKTAGTPDLQAALLTTYINNMLRDGDGNFTYHSTNWPGNNCAVKMPQLDFFTAFQLTDNSGTPTYSVLSNIAEADWNTNPGGKYRNYIFATAQVTATVDVWSPLLAVYFLQFLGNVSFDSATCHKIANPAGSLHNSTIPLQCFTKDCQISPDTCKNDLITYCDLQYTPPTYTTTGDTNNYLVLNKSQACKCYNSWLAPISQPAGGNPGSMCFNNQCSPEMLKLFGLDDTTKCKTYCDQVYSWMQGTGSDQPKNATYMDWVKFSTVCGTNYHPYTHNQVNIPIFIIGLIFSVLFILVSIQITKGKKSQVFGPILVGILSVGLTAFFTRDLAGLGQCWQKKDGSLEYRCTARITKMRLPDSFCNIYQNCECVAEEDCPSGCICVSSSCSPISGQRKYNTIKSYNWALIGIVVLLLAGFLAAYKLGKVAQKGLLWTSIALSVVSLFTVLFTAQTKKVFGDKCKSGGVTCQSDADCLDPGTHCVGKICEMLPAGCPVDSAPLTPPQPIPSGTYYIQFFDGTNYLYLYPQTNLPVVLSTNVVSTCFQTPQTWTYDADSYQLQAQDQIEQLNITCTIQPADLCLGKFCSGMAYARDVTKITPLPQFVLGQDNTLYSYEANAYLVPDTRPCDESICPQGNCGAFCRRYVTYTSDPKQAAVWTFTACDPKTTCQTGCGTCLPYQMCVPATRQCQIQTYRIELYMTPDFSDPPTYLKGIQSASPYYGGCLAKYDTTLDADIMYCTYNILTKQLYTFTKPPNTCCPIEPGCGVKINCNILGPPGTICSVVLDGGGQSLQWDIRPNGMIYQTGTTLRWVAYPPWYIALFDENDTQWPAVYVHLVPV